MVLVIDCTVIGLLPPTNVLPTLITLVFFFPFLITFKIYLTLVNPYKLLLTSSQLKKANPTKCITFSFSGSIGFPLTNSIKRNTNLLPSKAGIGSKLKKIPS